MPDAQWHRLQEFDWRAGYVSALIFASSGTNQGINIHRSPEVHAIGLHAIGCRV